MTRTRFETVLLETVVLITFALLVMLALPAHAQHVLTDSVPASGPGLIERLLTPGNVGVALGGVVSLIGGLVWLTQRRKKVVALAAYYAFHIVEDIGIEKEGDDAFDKTAEFLKQLDAVLVAKGWRPLKPGEVAGAKVEAQSLHGMEVAKVKVAEAAMLVGVAASKLPA